MGSFLMRGMPDFNIHWHFLGYPSWWAICFQTNCCWPLDDELECPIALDGETWEPKFFIREFAMERGRQQAKRKGGHFGDGPSLKKVKTGDLYDVSGINSPKGDRSYYRERFHAWRKRKGRDDPSQSLRVKQQSWNTFVKLETEGRMDSILGKPNRSDPNLGKLREAVHRECFESNQVCLILGEEESCRHCDCRYSDLPRGQKEEVKRPCEKELHGRLGQAVDKYRTALRRHEDDRARAMPHSPERYQRHRSSGGPSAPKCPSSEGSHASGPGSSAAPVVLDLSGDPSDSDSDPDDRQSTQQSSEFHQPSRSTVAEGSDRTVERLWRWKSFFRHLFSDIEALLDQLQKTVEEKIEKKFVDRFENLETNFAALYETVEESVGECGSLMGRLQSRHGDFEKLQEQAYDVLQVLRADQGTRGHELSTLRDDLDALRDLVEKVRRNQ